MVEEQKGIETRKPDGMEIELREREWRRQDKGKKGCERTGQRSREESQNSDQ